MLGKTRPMKTFIIILLAARLSACAYAQEKTITDILPAGNYHLNTSYDRDDQPMPVINTRMVTIVYEDTQPYIIIEEEKLKVHYRVGGLNGMLFYREQGNGLVVYSMRLFRGRIAGHVSRFSPGRIGPTTEYLNLVPIKDKE